MFKRIVVAVDGADSSIRAMSVAIALAVEHKVELYVLNVVDAADCPPDMDERGAILATAEATAKASVTVVNTKLITDGWGTVAAAILDRVRQVHADLIVLGTHDRCGLARILMGSDAESALQPATVPVLLVRALA